MFFEFCQESGYDTILRVLGSNVREFLQVKNKTSGNLRKGGMTWRCCCSGISGFVWINVNFQNLDALHDHLGTIYPGMRAPSFRCTDAEKGNSLILHYYSEREGLQDIVIGIIKTVAQQIHGTEIEMKVSSASFLPSFLPSLLQAASHRLFTPVSWCNWGHYEIKRRAVKLQRSQTGAVLLAEVRAFASCLSQRSISGPRSLESLEMIHGLSSFC